eukprot:TRINITY_DN7532_c0_g1_i1.p1 TRINITY_DN7532_c0_g1~~TRINITY_DN7532_c0_g1_i1.p1  ORF type:complete len:481 (-),score=66.64 TRINITY_DN7532_c0_g1_i1:4-1446(-)
MRLLLVFIFSTLSMVLASLSNTNCVIKQSATNEQMGNALSYVCGVIDCAPIQPGGSHFYPNTLRDHLNWAANYYFQLHYDSDASCDFQGIAELQCGSKNWTRIRGVNIGGWLLLEPWITPSLFQQFVNKEPAQTAVDEYSFWQILGTEEATSQLKVHWENWFNETDISLLASFGINTIRIPIGYWIFGDFPPFGSGGIYQLDRAISLAEKYNISVMIDLHGAPGSQNGFDNSGRTCGKCAGICPANFTWPTNLNEINQTIDVLGRLAKRYVNASNMLGIGLLNEPRWDVDIDVIKDFYIRAYEVVRPIVPGWAIVIHDAFRYNAWLNFMSDPQIYKNIIMDTHIYQSFTDQDITQTEDGHIQEACGYHLMVDWMECMQFPTVVGEWSLGTTDCPLYLRGFEQPPRAPILGVPCPHHNSDEFLKAYALAQLNTFERTHGWFFWNFKTESAPKWSYIDATKNGWLPPNVRNIGPYIQNACPS